VEVDTTCGGADVDPDVVEGVDEDVETEAVDAVNAELETAG